MEIATEILNAIEARAERAIAQEIPLMVKKILRLRPVLTPDGQDHADALLQKLCRLKSELVFVCNDETTPEQRFLREARAACITASPSTSVSRDRLPDPCPQGLTTCGRPAPRRFGSNPRRM